MAFFIALLRQSNVDWFFKFLKHNVSLKYILENHVFLTRGADFVVSLKPFLVYFMFPLVEKKCDIYADMISIS